MPIRPPPFDVLRETEPGRHEAGADIGLNRWTWFKILFEGDRFTAWAEGVKILKRMGKQGPKPGRIGLWVDIGTEGFFANLQVQA
jgi:hypothetical protein